MKITLENIIKRSVNFICIFNCFGNILSQFCQHGEGGNKTLMKWQELASLNISRISFGHTDFRLGLTSYLSRCSFTLQPNATSFGMCSALCMQQADCMAIFVDSNSACELCLATALDVDGNGSDYDVNKTMFAAELYVNFIDNGKSRAAYK